MTAFKTETVKAAVRSTSQLVSIELANNSSRFPALLTELIALNVDLIVARGTPAALAAKKATSTIPVVMAVGEPLCGRQPLRSALPMPAYRWPASI